MVPRTRIELARPCDRKILSLVRLPIPPPGHEMVTPTRFERVTPWLKVKCSTSWAKESINKIGWGNWIRTSGMPESKSSALPLGYTPIKMVGEDGFEPSNPQEQIYSLPRLTTSLFSQMVEAEGLEPPTLAV